MATFAELEVSRRSGQPITLYKFDYGDGPNSYITYTDSEGAVIATFGGVQFTFNPIAINRGDINSTGTMDKSSVTLELPASSELAQLYNVNTPTKPVGVTIRQMHVGADHAPVVWLGRIINVSKDGPKCTVTCEPFGTAIRRPGLRRYYQYGCPHVLYGEECRADKEWAKRTVTIVTEPVQHKLMLPVGWSEGTPFAKFKGGIVEWTTPDGDHEVRTIKFFDGNDAFLNDRIEGMPLGTVVNIFLGCNHRVDDCLELHRERDMEPFHGGGNMVNFGGFPWIPTDNPFGFKNTF